MSGRSIWDSFTQKRRLAWIRSKCQAEYRFETWDLPFEIYCQFWPTWDQWHRRGRHRDDLVLTRYYNQGPWHPDNVVQITRYQQLCANRRIRDHQDPQEFYQKGITYNDCKNQDPQIKYRKP